MATDLELRAQVQREAAEVASAPRVDSLPALGRCHFCGAITRNLMPAHDWSAPDAAGNRQIINERYRGEECCGH